MAARSLTRKGRRSVANPGGAPDFLSLTSIPGCAGGSDALPRDFADRKLVKVYTDERRRGKCKFCQQPVVWLKTVNRERFMLFDGDAVALKTGNDHSTGAPVEYYDREDCHWETCASQQGDKVE